MSGTWQWLKQRRVKFAADQAWRIYNRAVLKAAFEEEDAAHGSSPYYVRMFRLVALWWPFGRRLIFNRRDGSLYLARIYLYPQWLLRRTNLTRRYLHYFASSDEPWGYHNHPWENSESLILARGYMERVATSMFPVDKHFKDWAISATTHYYSVGDVVQIQRDRFHRVELIHGPAWSLFTPGTRIDEPEEESWGFISEGTGKYEHWEACLKRREEERRTQWR